MSGLKIPLNLEEFCEDFTKNYNEESDEGYFPKVDVDENITWFFLKHYKNFIMICYFYQKEQKLKKSKTLLSIYMINFNML